MLLPPYCVQNHSADWPVLRVAITCLCIFYSPSKQLRSDIIFILMYMAISRSIVTTNFLDVHLSHKGWAEYPEQYGPLSLIFVNFCTCLNYCNLPPNSDVWTSPRKPDGGTFLLSLLRRNAAIYDWRRTNLRWPVQRSTISNYPQVSSDNASRFRCSQVGIIQSSWSRCLPELILVCTPSEWFELIWEGDGNQTILPASAS